MVRQMVTGGKKEESSCRSSPFARKGTTSAVLQNVIREPIELDSCCCKMGYVSCCCKMG